MSFNPAFPLITDILPPDYGLCDRYAARLAGTNLSCDHTKQRLTLIPNVEEGLNMLEGWPGYLFFCQCINVLFEYILSYCEKSCVRCYKELLYVRCEMGKSEMHVKKYIFQLKSSGPKVTNRLSSILQWCKLVSVNCSIVN